MKRVGDLQPFRELSRDLDEQIERDAGWRGDSDPVVHALGELRRRLREAIEASENQEITITLDEYAELEDITRAAAHKRFRAGAIPGAVKIPGEGIVIPADYQARKTA